MSEAKPRSCTLNRVATLQALYWLHCETTGSPPFSQNRRRQTNRPVWMRHELWLDKGDGNGERGAWQSANMPLLWSIIVRSEAADSVRPHIRSGTHGLRRM